MLIKDFFPPLPRRGGRDREQAGSVLVIYTLAIVSVLLFAAIAVDLGNLTQTRQHEQNAADAAAESAVWDLASVVTGGSAPVAETNAVSDVYAYIKSNYPSIPTPWGPSDCGPPPTGVTASATTDCIGFFPSNSPRGIFVAIPKQNVNYTFARAGGITGQLVSAQAEASLQNAVVGYELPYAYPSTGATGLQCLKTGSGGSTNNTACTGFSLGSGAFGEVFSPRYLVYPGTPTGTGNDPVIEVDIDLGIDHALNINPSGANPNICDYNGTAPNCSGYNNSPPYDNANAVVTQTGQTLDQSGPALYNADQNPFSLDGCTFTVPRLNHPDGFQASGTCSQDNPTAGPDGPTLSSSDSFGSGLPLNGVHITNYLIGSVATPNDPTSSALYKSCYEAQGPPGDQSPSPSSDAIDKQVNGQNVWTYGFAGGHEDACLSLGIQTLAASAAPGCGPPPATTTCPSPIFSTDIVKSPRFGVVPVVQNPSTGKKGLAILQFDGVFLYDASGHTGKVDAINAWIFPLWMIQTGPALGAGGGGLFSQGPLVANLCSLTATPPNC
jgi:hypothetical protein